MIRKGRAPCCEKSRVKRGPWSPEEDLTLITFIQKHGHHNWRSLPKLAGLMRCGKSCRLRWINYLRPDVKRGRFSREEEDTIIHLHQSLGNKWSKIASYLPGRTDNEIKNVWNTHLKKRLILPPSPDDFLSSSSSPSSSSSSSFSSSSSASNSNTHDDQSSKTDERVDKRCDEVEASMEHLQEERQSEVNQDMSFHLQGNYMERKGEVEEFNDLEEIQLLLYHDDIHHHISSLHFPEANETLLPIAEQPLDLLLDHHQNHISTEYYNRNGNGNGGGEELSKGECGDEPDTYMVDSYGFEETYPERNVEVEVEVEEVEWVTKEIPLEFVSWRELLEWSPKGED